MKKLMAVILLLCLCFCCTGCAEEETGTELEQLIGEAQLGASAGQVEEALQTRGLAAQESGAAGSREHFDTRTLPAGDMMFHGFALRPDSDVTLRFTPAFSYRGEEVASVFAGAEFTLTEEDSPAFLAWAREELRDCPQVPARESGIRGEVYLVRCYSELTEREYSALARMTRQSRRMYGSETDLLSDPLAMLEESFADHLATARKGQEVAMFTVILTQNRWGEVTVSVEAYGEALYRSAM